MMEPKHILLEFALAGREVRSYAFPGVVLDPAPDGSRRSADAAELLLQNRSLEAVLVRGEPLDGPPRRISHSGEFIRYVPETSRRYSINLRTGFPQFLRALDAETRNDLRRAVRRFALASGGQGRLVEYRSVPDAGRFQSIAGAIRARTDPEELARLASQDAFRGYVLMSAGAAAAYSFCAAEGGSLVARAGGYDAACGRSSPGTVLLYLLIERLFAEAAFTRFEFSRGKFGPAEPFAAGCRPCGDIYLFRRSGRSLFAVAGHALSGMIGRRGVRPGAAAGYGQAAAAAVE